MPAWEGTERHKTNYRSDYLDLRAREREVNDLELHILRISDTRRTKVLKSIEIREIDHL